MITIGQILNHRYECFLAYSSVPYRRKKFKLYSNTEEKCEKKSRNWQREQSTLNFVTSIVVP